MFSTAKRSRRKPPQIAPPPETPAKYNRQHRYERKKAAESADIGDIPAVANPDRREACRLDLFRFLTTYFPQSTGLSPFSDDHRRVIERTQRCAISGGWFCNAVYRGFAKTTISENAAIWSTAYGHRKFVPIFGSSAKLSGENIDSIQKELGENDLLYQDFPEICHPIRALEGRPQRCASQTYQGQRTHIEWTADTVVLPTIAGSLAGGSILTAHSLGAASRGLKYKRSDGTQQRPDFVIIDDAQTDESAGSPHQTGKRLGIIRKSIARSGGHGKRLAMVLNGTVLQPDDLIEQLLDPTRNAAWQGERIKMVKRFSDGHEAMWLGEYARIRRTYDPETIGDQERAHADASEFYRRNREQMDRGCIVSWQHCFDPDSETSAIQHAYNILIDSGPEVFGSECQNEPMELHADGDTLKPGEIAAKINGLKRGIAPLGAEYLTAFIDVQGEVLFWSVVAWAPDFTGAVIDYGTFPDQQSARFSLITASRTLTQAFPGAGLEGRIHAGLTATVDLLLGREWRREDAAPMKIGKLLIDANWGKSTTTVKQFARRSPHAALILPSHGKYVGASSLPWDQFTKREGERIGWHWMLPSLKNKPGAVGRHALLDVNFWKSFVHTRLAIKTGDAGALSLFGQSIEAHRLFAEHLCAEYRVQTEGRGRKVDEWKNKPGHPDNHWLDCIVGCAAAASMLGAALKVGAPAPAAKPRPRHRAVTYLE